MWSFTYCISRAIEWLFSTEDTYRSHPWSLLKYTSVSESYFGSCKVEFAGIGLKYLHSELFYRRFLCACLRMAAEIFVNWRICKSWSDLAHLLCEGACTVSSFCSQHPVFLLAFQKSHCFLLIFVFLYLLACNLPQLHKHIVTFSSS